MIIYHDPQHVRYGFELPGHTERFSRISSKEFAPMLSLPHAYLLARLKELFEYCNPHPQGEYTLYLDLTDSPSRLTLTLLHGLRAELKSEPTKFLVRISQFVQLYPPSNRTRNKGALHWKGSTFDKDVNIFSRKVLQEFLMDLEARKLWALGGAKNYQPLPERLLQRYKGSSRPSNACATFDWAFTEDTEVSLADLTHEQGSAVQELSEIAKREDDLLQRTAIEQMKANAMKGPLYRR